ncbi:hypothetical protein J8I26_02365 [Herbaspirillum sp. LeCh32-8]|uniref:hypothetical protein n=1 Tax=Herbaspirillum sp. LeCh32-8 TaxID=2821356 RepID=UPI001AE23CCD|nr:hypothetical protein [Herbaspirillum sp. LeCh32-8]MBP0596928.1 hypothetical protein [Herbaspirillum sp. LeCh32-8]
MSFFSSFTRTDTVSRTRRRTVLGLVLSVLIHGVLFMVLRAKLNEPPRLDSSGKPDAPLQVTFVTPPTPAPKPDVPKAQPEPPKKAPAPPKKQAVKPAAKRNSPPASRTETARATPAPITPDGNTPPVAQAAPEMDFSSMINRNRERRQAEEQSAAAENAAARAAENPSANDIAKANIAFQERRGRGTNGVFEIVSKGPRVAQYTFRGWTSDQRRSQRQLIDVDAGPGGNVELAVVNSMIALIRKYYSGDFNWDSQRLGRVVVLSARPSDTRGLQSFLMDEFFRSGG